MGSVVFTWGLFEAELAARLITLLSACYAMDKVKTFFVLKRVYIGSQNDLKLLHIFKGQLNE